MGIAFQPATRKRAKLRLALDGPAGSGKTMTALLVAKTMAQGGKIAVIDTERGSASLYSDEVPFDVIELDDYSPDVYVEAIRTAEEGKYSVLVIDSLSHAWEGKNGALDMKDRAASRPGQNNWTAWREVTPSHNRLVDAMLQSKLHIIATMRSKMEYVQEEDERGKKVIRKVGLAPIQRPGLEYEFTLVGDLDHNHVLTVSKTRCKALDRGQFPMPGERFAKTILQWLEQGDPAEAKPASPAPAPATPDAASKAAVPAQGEEVVGAPPAVDIMADFRAAIAAAATVDALTAIGQAIAAAHKAKALSDAQRKELIGPYTERLRAVSPAQAAQAAA